MKSSLKGKEKHPIYITDHLHLHLSRGFIPFFGKERLRIPVFRHPPLSPPSLLFLTLSWSTWLTLGDTEHCACNNEDVKGLWEKELVHNGSSVAFAEVSEQFIRLGIQTNLNSDPTWQLTRCRTLGSFVTSAFCVSNRK